MAGIRSSAFEPTTAMRHKRAHWVMSTKTQSTISDDEAVKLRALNAEYNQWVDARRNKRNGWASFKPEELPVHLRTFDNDERATLELYDFVHDAPAKYFAYYRDEAGIGAEIVNFTGLVLGRVIRAGSVFHSNFGDKRRWVTVRAVNGHDYTGLAQLSAGTYVRLSKVKLHKADFSKH